MGIVALFIVAAGAITLLLAAYEASTNIYVLKTWEPVEAQLVDTTIKNEKTFTGIHSSRADNYLVTWSFRYNIGNVAHVASTDPGTHGNETQMKLWSRRFQPGQTLTIHYKPDNPDAISAAQWDWITFSHATWVAAWGMGIILLGILMRLFARVSFYSYRVGR